MDPANRSADLARSLAIGAAIAVRDQEALCSEGLCVQNILAELETAIPGLAPDLRSAFDDYSTSTAPPAGSLAAVVSDAFLRVLNTPGHRDESVRPFVELLERVAASKDRYVRDLAESVLGDLLDSGNDLAVAEAREVIGPMSRAQLDEMNSRWIARLNEMESRLTRPSTWKPRLSIVARITRLLKR